MKTEVVYFDNIKKHITYHIGQNDSDNFDVIDMGTPNDIWFHSNEGSSCHVIAKISEKMNKKELLTIRKKGAALCKENTNKLKKNPRVEFIYTYIKNITKTDVDGCVITTNTSLIIC